jgi:hypothetical protein
LLLRVLAVFAQHEREQISERVKAALAAIKTEIAQNGFRISKKGNRIVRLGAPDPLTALQCANAARNLRPPAQPVMDFTRWPTVSFHCRRAKCPRYPHAARLPVVCQLRFARPCSGTKTPLRYMAHALMERNDASALACGGETTHERNGAGVHTSFLNGPQFPAIPSATPSSAGREAIAEGTPMPSNLAEAERMLDLFTSVGARSFVVTKTDVEQKLIWGKSYTAAELRQKLPPMVRTSADRKPYYTSEGRIVSAGENLIVRPTGPEVAFVQLDDLSAEQLDRVRPAVFIIHATSPGNHQAWIALSGVEKVESKDFVRRVRKAVGDIDESASGATRMAGTFNFKTKYFPDYPTVAILHGVPGRVMTAERLQQMGLLAEPEPVTARPLRASPRSGGGWPDYERCVQGAPINHGKTGPDISRADYFWCLMAAQRNHSVEAIAAHLMELSSKAKENGEQYARITAENATAAAARGRQRSGA